MPHSIGRLSASASSHHSLSSAAFITNIAESDFRHAQPSAGKRQSPASGQMSENCYVLRFRLYQEVPGFIDSAPGQRGKSRKHARVQPRVVFTRCGQGDFSEFDAVIVGNAFVLRVRFDWFFVGHSRPLMARREVAHRRGASIVALHRDHEISNLVGE
jgi:hypothetical protein